MFENMKGQTLIEVLAALSILAIIATSMGAVVVSSLNSAQFAKNETLATKYAQEGMEAIRRLRNDNYAQFKTYSGIYCLSSIPAVLVDRPPVCSTPNVANFIRTVEIEQSPGCGVNAAKVVVMVSWSDGKCAASSPYCHTESNNSCLSTLNPLRSP